MGWPYDALIAHVTDRYNLANANRARVNSSAANAATAWNLGNDHDAMGHIIDALVETGDYMGSMLNKGFYGYNSSTYALPSALDRNMANPFITEAPEYDLTMSAIINTMLTANS
ncbi:hypothetical protein LCGC14_2603240, partial [marine sediment metagenome]